MVALVSVWDYWDKQWFPTLKISVIYDTWWSNTLRAKVFHAQDYLWGCITGRVDLSRRWIKDLHQELSQVFLHSRHPPLLDTIRPIINCRSVLCATFLFRDLRRSHQTAGPSPLPLCSCGMRSSSQTSFLLKENRPSSCLSSSSRFQFPANL